MDIRQLTYFVTVVEEGSISAAARKLYMSQPPITAQLKALETELGCTLLLRGARAVRLTQPGRLLYERAKTILELTRQTSEEIALSGGMLRLGAVSSVAGSLLPQWLHRFCQAHPEVRFELHEENTYQLLESLRQGRIEAAIVRTPFPQDGLTVRPLLPEHLVAYAASAFLPESLDAVSLAQLSALPLLVYRRWEQIVRQLFQSHGLNPHILCLNDQAATTLRMAEQEMGVGLVPQSATMPGENKGCRVVPLLDADVATTITAVYRDNISITPILFEFLDSISLYNSVLL